MTTETATTDTTQTPLTTEPPANDGLIGDGQTAAAAPPEEQTSNWWDGLQSEELKSSKSLEKFKSMDDMVSAYLGAEKEISSRIKVPDKADSEALGDIYDKLGRPEDSSKYDFSEIEHAPLLSHEENSDMVSKFAEFAHKEGLSQRQAASMVNWTLGQTVAQAQQAAQTHEENIAAIKKEFGASFDERVQLGNDTLKMLVQESGGDWERLSGALANSPLSSQPDLVMALSKMGMMMKQDRIYDAGGEPRSMGGMTRGELRAQIEKIKRENADDLVQSTPKGRDAQKEINRLLDLIGKAAPED